MRRHAAEAAVDQLNRKIAGAGFGLQPRAVLDHYSDGVKLPRLAALGLKAEDVLAMHFLAHQFNGLLQAVLLQKAHGLPASGLGEQRREIRFVQAYQLADRIDRTGWAEVERN